MGIKPRVVATDAPASLRYYAHITDCLRTGGDGVSEAYGKDIWAVLAEQPEQVETFQRAMTNNSASSEG